MIKLKSNARLCRNTVLLLSLSGLMLSNAQAGSVKYPDALLTTPGTPEIVQKGLEADGYSLGVLAYTWGYPLVRMERVMREYVDVPSPKPATSYRAPLNQIGWARELASPAAKDMPTANNDTAYMSNVVKLDGTLYPHGSGYRRSLLCRECLQYVAGVGTLHRKTNNRNQSGKIRYRPPGMGRQTAG